MPSYQEFADKFYNPSSWRGPALGAGFVVKDPKTGLESIQSANDRFSGTGSASSSGGLSISTTTGGGQAALPELPPGPEAPDLGRLNDLADKVARKKAIEKAMKEYDELSAATQASGFQMAGNAGNIYSQRMMQAGMSPVASGVVSAQARLPVYRQLAEIGTQKEQTRIDAVSKADQLSAQIASTIAGLQQQHATTLAEFNLKEAGYQLDLNKFNASQEMEASRLAIEAARSRAAGIGGGGIGGRSGSGTGSGEYTPSWFEKASQMTAANNASPQAATWWQRLGAAANAGGFADKPSFPTIYI